MFDLSKKENSVLNLFLDLPTKEFHLRETARLLKISSSTAKLSLDKLKAHGLILEKGIANLRVFKANLENIILKEMKKTKNLSLIKESAIAEYIQKTLNPASVVLFGSFAKGTNDEKSDIDLLIITNKKKQLSLLGIKGNELQIIQLTPLEWKEKVKKDKPFYQEIITTGITLLGEMPI